MNLITLSDSGDAYGLVFGAVGVLFGIGMFVEGFRVLKRKRMIESTATSKIRSLAVGLSEIYGKAITKKEPMIAPFSGKPCVYCKYKLEEYDWKAKREWTTKKEGTMGTKFFLKDDTGSVEISTKNADVDIPESYNVELKRRSKIPKILLDYLLENKIEYKRIAGLNKKFRFTETRIEPNDSLYVLGRASINHHVVNAESGAANLIMQKSRNPDIYYISNEPEKKILKSLNKFLPVQLVCGPLLIGGGSLLIIFILGLG